MVLLPLFASYTSLNSSLYLLDCSLGFKVFTEKHQLSLT